MHRSCLRRKHGRWGDDCWGDEVSTASRRPLEVSKIKLCWSLTCHDALVRYDQYALDIPRLTIVQSSHKYRNYIEQVLTNGPQNLLYLYHTYGVDTKPKQVNPI